MLTIRWRLLLFLLPALSLFMLIDGYADYRTAVTAVTEAYDYSLASQAAEISSYITVDDGLKFTPSVHLQQVLYNDGLQPRLFAVVDGDDNYVAGSMELAKFSQHHLQRPEIIQIAQHEYRLVTLYKIKPVHFVVLLAEPTTQRNRALHAIIVNVLLMDFIELYGSLFLVWFGVYFALRPLGHFREVIDQQSIKSPQPFNEREVPVELRPMAVSFNNLLLLLDEVAASQRRFIANAAHQMRTPVTALKAQFQLLLENSITGVLPQESTAISNSLQRLTHVADQLLALATTEQSMSLITAQFQRVDLNLLVEKVVELHLDHADRVGIDLGVETQPLQVMGDAGMLADLLSNLIDNALKYTPSGGRVTVRCSLQNGLACLEVDDTGPGIPESERHKVLERFYRMSDSQGTGSGLGLAIVKEICRVHSAKLVIGEGRDHAGASIRVDFPADIS